MSTSSKKVALSHIADIYLYEYYVAKEQAYELDMSGKIAGYIKKSHQLMNETEYEEALMEWKKVLSCNPVCMEAYSGLIACYKYLYEIEKEYEATLETYNYCCTRAELAAYYRNLGWYYLESYQPNVAVACYQYSELFEKSEQVKSEIPLKANSTTLALLYKAGLEAYEIGNPMQARDCFSMVYDLTQDDEIKKILEEIPLG